MSMTLDLGEIGAIRYLKERVSHDRKIDLAMIEHTNEWFVIENMRHFVIKCLRLGIGPDFNHIEIIVIDRLLFDREQGRQITAHRIERRLFNGTKYSYEEVGFAVIKVKTFLNI